MGNLVLVIDDSITICKVIKVSLQRVGYEVVYFRSGEAAIHCLGSSELRVPDFIFVDLCLPGMDGYSVVRCLRSLSSFKSIPIIIISRFRGLFPPFKARLAGANGYVMKPFNVENLVSVVHNYLSGSHRPALDF